MNRLDADNCVFFNVGFCVIPVTDIHMIATGDWFLFLNICYGIKDVLVAGFYPTGIKVGYFFATKIVD
jgi:hypothetical protein